MTKKHLPKSGPMGLEEAKRYLEEHTNEPLGRELATNVMVYLQGQLPNPSIEDTATLIYALEFTRYTILQMARTQGYAKPTRELMEATRVVVESNLKTALALGNHEAEKQEPN